MQGKFTLKWRVKSTDTWYTWSVDYDSLEEINKILKNVSAANPTQEYKVVRVIKDVGQGKTYVD